PSGRRPRSLRPSCGKLRPAHDISTALLGGPTAWDARLASGSATCTGLGVPPVTVRTNALGSVGPAGFTPLKVLFARPSQKLRKKKMAFTLLGALRPVTRRMPLPKTGSGCASHLSAIFDSFTKVFLATPCEPTTSPVSTGKKAGLRLEFRLAVLNTPSTPGLSWFLVRTSAPA